MARQERQFRSLPRDERRDRIVLAAKQVLLENGWDATNMDDVAARAGTTKPTVYAHFKSKDELFAAVADLVKRLMLDALQGPEVYAGAPLEAVALFCGRYLELISCRDPVNLQRAALAASTRSPEIAVAVYEGMYAGAAHSLADYLRARKLTKVPELNADFLLSVTVGGLMIRNLFGVDEPKAGYPDAKSIGARVDMKRIRTAVKLIAAEWIL